MDLLIVNIKKVIMGLLDKIKPAQIEEEVNSFTAEEIEFLLRIIKDATFKGGELPLLVNLINKLQQQHKFL